MSKVTKSQSGLTLVEILVVTFISVIVGGTLLVIMTNSSGLFFKQSSKVDQGLKTNDALTLLRSNIKQSSAVAASYTISESVTYTSGINRLVLKVPAFASDGNMITGVYDYFVYLQDGNLLRFITFPAPQSQTRRVDQVLTTVLERIEFRYFNNAIPPSEVAPDLASKVKATLFLKQRAGLDSEQTIVTSEANLRND